jgi:hypothetical protein
VLPVDLRGLLLREPPLGTLEGVPKCDVLRCS